MDTEYRIRFTNGRGERTVLVDSLESVLNLMEIFSRAVYVVVEQRQTGPWLRYDAD